MADTKDKPVAVTVDERLLELHTLGLSSEEVTTLRAITDAKPVKIQLQVVLPPAPADKRMGGDELIQKIALKPVREVVARYQSLLSKPVADGFRVVLEKYKADQEGQAGCFEPAQAALDKICKYVGKQLEDFRVDLREAIAKRLSISAKAIMTVGSITAKEVSIVSGSFNSEVDFTDDKTKGNDLAGAFKKKKWQYCGAAFDSAEGKVFVDPKKKFKKADLKKLEELFQEDERSGLKFAKGQVQADSETKLTFEFMKKDGNKLPGNDGVIRKLLMRGLKNQTGKNYSAIIVKVVEEYSAEVGTSTKGDDVDGKADKKPEAKTPSKAPKPLPKRPSKEKAT